MKTYKYLYSAFGSGVQIRTPDQIDPKNQPEIIKATNIIIDKVCVEETKTSLSDAGITNDETIKMLQGIYAPMKVYLDAISNINADTKVAVISLAEEMLNIRLEESRLKIDRFETENMSLSEQLRKYESNRQRDNDRLNKKFDRMEKKLDSIDRDLKEYHKETRNCKNHKEMCYSL